PPCCRQVATTVSIRSTNRLPCSLSVPPLMRCQITACRKARSAALFVGSTPGNQREFHRPSSNARIPRHVSTVVGHPHSTPSFNARRTEGPSQRICLWDDGEIRQRRADRAQA